MEGTLTVSGATPGHVFLAGTITNNGTLTLTNGRSISNQNGIYLAADTLLNGTGETILSGSFSEIANDSSASRRLSIANGYTLRGGGYIQSYSSSSQISVINAGAIIADSTTPLNFSGDSFINRGLIRVNKNSTFNAREDSIVQDSPNGQIEVNGVLRIVDLDLQAGSLGGSGEIFGNVVSSGGVINAGNSPGKLTINGDLTLSDESLIVVEILGREQGISYDWISVSGNVYLDGDLRFDFANDVELGDSFLFLTSNNGTIAGAFDRIYSSSYSLDLNYNTHGLTVTVLAAIPEPQTYLLMLAGLGFIGSFARRQAFRRVATT